MSDLSLSKAVVVRCSYSGCQKKKTNDRVLGQERNIRSGTLPSQLIAGLGAACDIAKQEMERDEKHVRRLWDMLWKGLASVRAGCFVYRTLSYYVQRISHIEMNGDPEARYHGNLNVSFAFIEGEVQWSFACCVIVNTRLVAPDGLEGGCLLVGLCVHFSFT